MKQATLHAVQSNTLKHRYVEETSHAIWQFQRRIARVKKKKARRFLRTVFAKHPHYCKPSHKQGFLKALVLTQAYGPIILVVTDTWECKIVTVYRLKEAKKRERNLRPRPR